MMDQELVARGSRPASRQDDRRDLTQVSWLLQVMEPLVVLVMAPIALVPSRFSPSAAYVALALLAVPFAVRLLTTGRLTAAGLAGAPLGFLLLVALPVTAWISPYFWELTWPELLRAVWGMAVFFAVVNWANPVDAGHSHRPGPRRRTDPRLVILTVAFFGLGLAFTTLGLLNLRGNDKLPFVGSLVAQLPAAAQGLPGVANPFNANRVGGLAMIFVPLALALVMAPSVRRSVDDTVRVLMDRLVLAGGLAFFGGALLLTQSRAALLGVGVGVVVILALAGRRGWLPLALILLLAVGSLAVFGPAATLDIAGIDRIEGAPDAGALTRILADPTMASRIMLWRRALHGIADAPLTGMGLATFQQIAQEPYPLEGFRPDPDIGHAHNLFLQTGLDLGLPGLTAFVTFLTLVGVYLAWAWRGSAAGSPARLWVVGMLGSYAAYLVYSLLDAITLGARPAVAGWFLAGLIVAAGEQARRRHQRRASRHHAEWQAQEMDAGPASSSAAHQSDWERRAWAATAMDAPPTADRADDAHP